VDSLYLGDNCSADNTVGVLLGLRIVLGKTGVGPQAHICGGGENSLWLEILNIILRAKGDLINVIRIILPQ